MKKALKITLISIILLIISYLTVCVYIIFKVDEILKSSYESYGENNIYSEIVSDNIFKRLSYRRHENEYNVNSEEKNIRTFPWTLWLGNKAYLRYIYT
jgi:hypothetical protein